MAHRENFIAHLRDHIVIGDGAMATQLYQLGVPVGASYHELNVTQPDVVAAVHRSYYEAGARLIETNTFGAHRLGLERYGLEDQLGAINSQAVRIARSAVGADAYVAATIGSIAGHRLPEATDIDLARAYREQAQALLTEEPDAILLETFLDVTELQLAIRTVRELCALPIIAQLSLIEHDVTRDGLTVTEGFARLLDAGADVVGLNCRYGPADIARSLSHVQVPPGTLLSAYPNAGLLSLTDGHYTYPSKPAYFGEMAESFRQIGVRLLGGCCGTTPDHVRAMATALADVPPLSPKLPARGLSSITVQAVAQPPQSLDVSSEGHSGRTKIHEKVREAYTVIVELDPPKELSAETFLTGAKALQDAGADAVTLADNSLAVTRMSNMALGALMKREGVEPLLHLSCRDRNLIGQQSHLMGLHALGIDQILVITGDPSRFGDFPGASSVFDVSSMELIAMIKQLNQGTAFTGRKLAEPSHFVVGAAFNPHVRHLDKAIARLERKVAAGADFIMTQPIYDPKLFEILREATVHIPAPIFVGVMPLTSGRNAEFLHNEVPGIALTEEVRARMGLYQGARARAEGLAIARELLDAAMASFRGLYLITPLLRYEMTVDLTTYIRERQVTGKSAPQQI